MNNTLVVPFDLYTDEYVVWMETFKNTHSKNIIQSVDMVGGILTKIGILFIALAVILKGKYTLLNVAAFLGACTVITYIIMTFAFSIQHKKIPKTTYYVTNYRLIEVIESKQLYFKIGYLKNLICVDIDTDSKIPTFVEFEWDEKADLESSPSGFFDIDNCREIYDIIKKQQNELTDIEYNFNFVAQ